MSEIFINPAKTCAITGHTNLPKNFKKDALKKAFKKIILDGYDTFLDGMALRFDVECFKVLFELKKKYDIKIIACIPCPTQSIKYNAEQKKQYDYLLGMADEKILISDNYTPYCMHKRNRFMVDNASLVLAYLTQNYGGTYATINYAKTKNIKVINLFSE